MPLNRLWVEHVNQPQHEAEVQAIAESIRRGRPYGGEQWQSKVARPIVVARDSWWRTKARRVTEKHSRPAFNSSLYIFSKCFAPAMPRMSAGRAAVRSTRGGRLVYIEPQIAAGRVRVGSVLKKTPVSRPL